MNPLLKWTFYDCFVVHNYYHISNFSCFLPISDWFVNSQFLAGFIGGFNFVRPFIWQISIVLLFVFHINLSWPNAIRLFTNKFWKKNFNTFLIPALFILHKKEIQRRRIQNDIHILNFPGLGSAEFTCLQEKRVRISKWIYTLFSTLSWILYSTFFGFSSKENFQNFSTQKLVLFVTSFTHKVTITQVFFTSHSII